MFKSFTDLSSDFDEDRFMDIKHKIDVAEEEKKALLICGSSDMTSSRLEEIEEVLNLMVHRPLEFDDQLIRQLITKITVLDKSMVEITFVSGKTVRQDVL